jgi:hypothetical protein
LCEQAHHPRCKNELNAHLIFVKVLNHLPEFFFQKPLQHLHVLVEAWKLLLINEPKLVILDEVDKQREGNDFV